MTRRIVTYFGRGSLIYICIHRRGEHPNIHIQVLGDLIQSNHLSIKTSSKKLRFVKGDPPLRFKVGMYPETVSVTNMTSHFLHYALLHIRCQNLSTPFLTCIWLRDIERTCTFQCYDLVLILLGAKHIIEYTFQVKSMRIYACKWAKGCDHRCHMEQLTTLFATIFVQVPESLIPG